MAVGAGVTVAVGAEVAVGASVAVAGGLVGVGAIGAEVVGTGVGVAALLHAASTRLRIKRAGRVLNVRTPPPFGAKIARSLDLVTTCPLWEALIESG